MRRAMDTAAPKGQISSLKPLLAHLAPYRGRVVLALVLIAMTSGAMLGIGAALRYLVDAGLSAGSEALLNRAFALMLGIILLLAGVTYVRYTLVAWLGEQVVADIRRTIFERFLALDIGFFETARTGDLLSRLTTDTTLLQTVVGYTVSVTLRNVLMITGGLTLMVLTSPDLSIYVLLLIPVVVVPLLVLGRKVRVLSRETQQKVADINAHAEETLSSIRTVQAMTMESLENERFAQKVRAAVDTAMGRIRLRGFLTALVIGLILGGVVTVLWMGGHDVLSGQMSGGQLSAFVFYAVLVAGAVGGLSEAVTDLQRAAGASERLNELLQVRAAVASPASPVPMTGDKKLSVAFEEVRFTYPARPDTPALTDISFRVDPGEVVALVGPSGAGKTTIFQLMLRFYDPELGAVHVGEKNIRTLDLQAYRRMIGLVPQDPVIFSADAWTNIRCGRPDATDAEIRAAAEAAGALGFLETLPQGMATYLGEKGVQLSGGQRQRLAIARALIREPRLLLLDEATSALDAENERLVQQGLKRLMEGRTTLIIAHRLSTVRHASRILYLDKGCIEASGTHEELMKSHPPYARLVQLQMREWGSHAGLSNS